MKVFVTGGAGYVGSFAVKALVDHGNEVVVFDNLEKGHDEITSRLGVKLVRGDLRRREDISQALDSSFEAVMHFAAYTAVGPSMKDPHAYFENNVQGGLNLLSVVLERGIEQFVFSSSSEVYGEAESLPLVEDMPLQATNPYGESKVQLERILYWYSRGHGLRYVALRYFNAGGAALDGSMGEDHRPETHLIPAAIRGALGLSEFKLTCATDLDTPDGSPVRDYTHVLDIANAHVRSLEYLAKGGESTGAGNTVLEVVKRVEEVSGVELAREKGETRGGEPSAKWAANEKIRRVLGWEPKYDLSTIVESAYLWHKAHPAGYTS